MDSAPFPDEGPSEPGAHFRHQMQAWRQSLARCRRKPGRKYVHDLRVVTLRTQSAIEYWMRQKEPDAALPGVVQRWIRQGKKLRRLLGPVRQADVSLNKLSRVRRCVDSADKGQLVLPKECLSAIEEIQRVVMRRRQVAAKKLVAEIQQRRKRLKRLSRKVETALNSFVPARPIGVADSLQAQIAAAAAQFPALDSENLHAFRKRIKKIRYLAEVFAPVDLAAARAAASLKRMSGAIGEWHDWHMLTEEAALLDLKNAAKSRVADFLQAHAALSFDRARSLCIRSTAGLLNGSASGTAFSAAPGEQVPRKPVLSVLANVPRMHPENSRRAS